jgi:hypothetical protein
MVSLFCRFVTEASTSLSAASHVLRMLFPVRDGAQAIPHATTGRQWLLRVGLFKLERPKAVADDWVWLIDHLMELGTCRCLMIIGVRLSELPAVGSCLELRHLEPIAILPVDQSNQEIVAEQLDAQVVKTGVPRAILSDAGSDLLSGERRFQERHPQTVLLSDIAHYGARLLKHRLEKNDRWQEFCQQASQTKCLTGQTEWGFLTPPNQRSKSRFMNLERLLSWAETTLTLLERQPPEVLKDLAPERLNEKFGWLCGFRSELAQWSSWHRLTETAIDLVRREGYSATTASLLESRLHPLIRNEAGERLKSELVEFVAEQSSQVGEGERFPGSTEILESSFGKLKSLQGDHQKGGFTHLILSYAALLGKTTPELMAEALKRIPIKRMRRWCAQHLGMTLQSRRTTAHRVAAALGAQENLEEPPPP